MRVERIADAAAREVIDAIAGLEAEAFTNPWSRDSLIWELENSDVTRVHVLRDDEGTIVAFSVCWIIFDELHINTLAVAPAVRRRGFGTLLLEAVLTEAERAGAGKATLEVRASNAAALALYERLGFRVSARRPGYYTNPPEDALILWREGGTVRL
jgi:ribosomal-protein-alanine N-acetyltransferase